MPASSKAAAHRFVYELLVGPIPAGLTIDHLCRVTSCVRPDHLEPVTNAENVRRMNVSRRQEARALIGIFLGHPLEEE